MRALPRAQARVYGLLRAASERGEELPGVAELARALGVRHSTVNQHLRALDAKGVVRFESRGVGLRPLLALRLPPGVPVVGSIPAGPLSDALEHPEGYLNLPFGSEHFALRVKGDSMFERIEDGALRHGSIDTNGDFAALDMSERSQVRGKDNANHGSVCTSTETTAGRSRTIGDQVFPASGEA